MKSKRFNMWSKDKLESLRQAQDKSQRDLCLMFDCTPHELKKALEFIRSSEGMVQDRYIENGVTVTLYKPHNAWYRCLGSGYF